MFHTYNVRTADEAWRSAWRDLQDPELTRPNSLSGGSQEILHFGMSITDPRQRWVNSRRPAINPAFALAEVVWMIRGRRDASFLTAWNSALTQFAGSDPDFHGAYGYRLRHHFGVDQLTRAARVLSSEPDHRQVVLELWDPRLDLPAEDGTPTNADIPCNVCALVKVDDDRLEWLQVMRSNDLNLGLPYNLIQWTTVQEVLAGWLGLELGSYNHVSDSLHVYDRDRNTYESDTSEDFTENTDDLRLPMQESLAVFREMEEVVSILAVADSRAVMRRITKLSLPGPYVNWMLVIASERLRKIGASSDARSLAQSIQNPALAKALQLWNRRFEVPR